MATAAEKKIITQKKNICARQEWINPFFFCKKQHKYQAFVYNIFIYKHTLWYKCHCI